MTAAQVNITLPSNDDGESVSFNARYSVVHSPPESKELESLNNAPVLSGSQSNLCNGGPTAVGAVTKSATLRKVSNNIPKKANITLAHFSKRPPVDIQFIDLKYSVSEGRRRGYKTILKAVNGKFKSGELTGIMGPSGAGKSTLMNILAGCKSSNLEGSLLINGKERNQRRFRKMSCYIMQDDCLSPHLSVLEAMTVSANLKIDTSVSKTEKRNIINEVLEILGLQDCADTASGCLSGGQRKRLSIALELVNNPPVMFFDEPTSGLDSSSCFQCLCLLKSLARGGRTIICTIHQPSARLFEMFDHLYMLAEGQCIYRGPVMNLVPFLASLGLNCPSYHNPADYVMEVACGEHGDYVQKLVIAVNAGRCTTALSKALEAAGQKTIANDIAKETTQINPNGDCVKATTNNALIPPTCTTSLLESSENLSQDKSGFPTSGFYQFMVLLTRSICTIFRDKTLTRLRLLSHFLVGILIGAIFYGIGNDAAKVMSNSGCLFFTVLFLMFTSMMPTILTFPMEMSVFVREHLNYWYSLKAYYFAKTLADIPFQVVMTTGYIVGVYFITDQPREPIRFFMFLGIAVLTALVSQSFGLLVGAAFNIEAGVFLGPISTIPMVLFSGFFAKLEDIPFYFQWLPYISYVKYSFEGTMVAIYGLNRAKLECGREYCHFKYPSTFLQEMSFSGDMTTYCIDMVVLVLLFILLRIGAYFMLRIRIMQSR